MAAVLALVLAALGGVPVDAAAQLVRGTVVEEGSEAPVEAAFVVLVDERGRRGAGWLTPASGAFTLRAPAPGRYHLRVERIGYRAVDGEPFDLASGETVVRRLVTPAEAVSLGEIAVASERRCEVRPAEGTRTADLWEEARKALEVAAWTDERSLVSYETVAFERTVDPESGRILSERTEERGGWGRSPFRSVPAEELEAEGFVQDSAGVLSYYAPDAEVLLSDVFLRSHCFAAVVGEEGGVGIEFEPLPGPGAPDIRGVLWLDPETALLERLEYRYARLPEAVAAVVGDAPIGGDVAFERLGSGAWIVRRWAIRMPVFGRRSTVSFGDVETFEAARGDELAEIREVGGEVLRATTADQENLMAVGGGDRGAVTGIVWDSAAAAPLADAVVFLSGTNRRGRSGADGRFRIDDVPPGGYRLAFQHDRLARLGLTPPPVSVVVAAGEVVAAGTGIPSERTVLEESCGDRGQRPSEAMVAGSVVSSPDGDGLSGEVVEVRWVTFASAGGAVRALEDGVRVETDRSGSFRVCRVPEEAPVSVRLLREGEVVVVRELGPLLRGRIADVVLDAGGRR